MISRLSTGTNQPTSIRRRNAQHLVQVSVEVDAIFHKALLDAGYGHVFAAQLQIHATRGAVGEDRGGSPAHDSDVQGVLRLLPIFSNTFVGIEMIKEVFTRRLRGTAACFPAAAAVQQ